MHTVIMHITVLMRGIKNKKNIRLTSAAHGHFCATNRVRKDHSGDFFSFIQWALNLRRRISKQNTFCMVVTVLSK